MLLVVKKHYFYVYVLLMVDTSINFSAFPFYVCGQNYSTDFLVFYFWSIFYTEAHW